uniref:Pheromone n=1 Tax=Lentinula edodes TaxID=5353 RepID=T1RLM6_LENED|nr:pheromone precursor [Lentinula edodes]AGC14713.1 pheromone precursor [Lentinula edodes]AGC14722.1 pheromone precursor [Lentinula edodes]AGC14731.1 pheromone precursor [Lentinula edodes]AGC14740.1 pheromone precursor [Lentinula edodes]
MDVFESFHLIDCTSSIPFPASEPVSPNSLTPVDSMPVNTEHDTNDSAFLGFCVVA